jgi:hypothetical protein
MIWADALCINQENSSEKCQQVSRMDLIFENAFRVLIWLGKGEKTRNRQNPSTYQSCHYRAFSGVCKLVNAWRKTFDDTTTPLATHSPELGEPPIDSAEIGLREVSKSWHDIFKIYSRRWFSRLWVIQEVVLAREATVLWDECEISWERIGLAAAIIRTNFDTISNFMRTYEGGSLIDYQFDRQLPSGIVNAYFIFRISKSLRYLRPLQLSFCELLKYTRQFHCQDNRDRIFGLLGLPTTDSIQRTIIPDYSKTVDEIYLLAANKIIQS